MLAQIIGFFAVIFFIFSIQNKDKSKILMLQTIANFLYAISYFLLGVYTAGLMNVVSMIRCGVFANYDKNKKDIPLSYLCIFLGLILLLGIFSFNGYLSLLPIIITVLYFVSTYQKNMKIIRLVFFFCSMIWFYYNFNVGAYTALMGNIFEFTSGLIALFRFDKKKYNKLYYKLKELPKVDLHLHLDGSANLKTLAKLTNNDLEEVKNKVVSPIKCQNLADYLKRFDLPIKAMQSKDNLQEILAKLLETLVNQNVIYAEIRFAPSLHTKKMSQEEVVTSLLEIKDNYAIKCNFILCLMRNNTYEVNEETINVAKKYLNKGVVALDLAGDEKKYPTKDFSNLFTLAKKYQIPFTIHAGEADNYHSIIEAIDMGASRIGHGINCIYNQQLMQRIKEEDICLEVCPTSNIETNVISDIKSHPVHELYQNELPVTINTDNMTVSNTNLIREYGLLIRKLDFTISDIVKMDKIAINHAFLTAEEKVELLNKY